MSEPHISEVLRNYTTAIALIVGGAWAFYRWSFSEWLRGKREMPAIDGKLDVKVIPNSDNTAYVTLEATWNNRSPLPIPICTTKTSIDIYIIPADFPFGVIDSMNNLDKPFLTHKPYENMVFVLEPLTQSRLQSHYKLEKNRTYLFRWLLYRDENYYSGKVWAWWKEIIIDLSEQNITLMTNPVSANASQS